MEAKALATITEKNIRSFVWRNIICRYEIPKVIISNNGKQFDNSAFKDFQVGDLVLQKVMGATKDPSQGKLRPN